MLNIVRFASQPCTKGVLFETWTNKNSDNNINGYTSFNFYWKFQNRRVKRKNGGVAFYLKDSIANDINVVKHCFDKIVWLK